MFLIIALLLTCLVYAQQMTNTTSSTSTTAVSSTTTTLPINGTTMDSNSTTTTGGGTPIDVTKLPALAWIVTGGCLAAVLFFNIAIVRYYTHRHESELFPFIVTVAALTVTLFAVFLVPLDVYLADAGPINGDVVRYAYYILYLSIMAFTFVFIPFAYFYYEENDEDATFKDRVIGGCKYTSFLIVILIVLIIIGALIKSHKPDVMFDPTNAKSLEAWADSLFSKSPGDFVITFGLSCLTLLGFLVLITYTAYGMAAMPVDLMRGHKSLEEEEASVYSNLNLTKEKKRNINAKYLSGKQMSKDDERKLAMLSRQERVLSKEGARIEDQQSGCNRCLAFFRPFAFVFGVLLFLFSLFLFISVLMTQIVKILVNPATGQSASICGPACGYIINTPWLNNPLDYVLQLVARVQAFIDVALFAAVILYLFFVTLSGIAKLGIRILWINLFQLKKRASPPQGLMLAAVLLVLAMLAINTLLMTLAPQYTTFGGQTYRNDKGEIVPCALTAPIGLCHMSQISQLVAMINLNLSFFGVAFYWGTWVFVATTFLSCFIAIVRCRRSNIDRSESDSDEPE